MGNVSRKTDKQRRLSSPKSIFCILLLGETNVGKSHFLRNFIGVPYEMGIDSYSKKVTIKTENGVNKEISFRFSVHPGQERFRIVALKMMSDYDGIIVFLI